MPAIVLIATSRPWPNDVRPPVFSRSIAASTSAWSAVGCWVTSAPAPKATSADVDRRRLGGDEAPGDVLGDGEARRLDVVGAHAVGHVDDDQHGAAGARRARVACGRERAKIITASAASSRANGTWRRRAEPAATRRRPAGPTRPARRRREPAGAAARRRPRRARGTSTRAASSDGQTNVIVAAASIGGPSRRARRRGRRRWRCRGGARRPVASPPAAPARAASTSAWKRRRNSGSLVSATTCSPVSASSTTIRPTSGSSRSSGSTRRTATTSWRWARRASGRSQPSTVMKSDTRNTSERRRIVASAACSRPARSVVAPGAVAAGRSRVSSWPSRRTWVRPERGGTIRSTCSS